MAARGTLATWDLTGRSAFAAGGCMSMALGGCPGPAPGHPWNQRPVAANGRRGMAPFLSVSAPLRPEIDGTISPGQSQAVIEWWCGDLCMWGESQTLLPTLRPGRHGLCLLLH